MRTLLTVVGARPQFVKASALTRSIRATPDMTETMVHTGQHFDAGMSAVFFNELGIPEPAVNLEVASCSHGEMTGRMLIALDPLLVEVAPDAVLVYGDTNSTLAGALAASKLGIPLFHVEAGLRSFNRAMPEEINRVLTDHVSDLLFCPTEASVRNLASEGITRGVRMVGDIMYDAALWAGRHCDSALLGTLGLERGGYALATVHRAENVDDIGRLVEVLQFLNEEASHHPVVIPLHPRTAKAITRLNLDTGRLRCIEPVGYGDMTALLSNAAVVLTDSGGVQKEAYFHRVPCVTLRNETEWVETVDCGWNRLWRGADFGPRREIHDYGDGNSAQAVLAAIREFFAP